LYFKNLRSLLKTEQDEDRRTYQLQTQSASVSERRSKGLAWYPVAIRGTEISSGDYLVVEIERTTHQETDHQLRFGSSVALFSNNSPQADRLEGSVSFQGGNTLKLSLRTDELPEWAGRGKLGVDLLFDDVSYDEMQNALKQAAVQYENQKESRLIRILTGEESPSFQVLPAFSGPGSLNESQQEAVKRILAAEDLAIVHGPPGTGKTTTLVQAALALIAQDGKQLLVVAPSNTAVDLLTEKLADEGLNVLRVGNPARISERLSALTLDSKVASHNRSREMKSLKKQAAEYRNMAHKYKRNYGKAEREQRNALFDEVRKIMKEVRSLEKFIMDELVEKAQVITATLVGSNHYTVRNLRYHTLIIDEAGQALEPACWIPVLKCRKLVMSGDPFQLPPTIKSRTSAKEGLEDTLFEKNMALHPEAVVLLNEQYRMNNAIMGYSSKVFYYDKLKAHSTVAAHTLFPGDLPLLFIDTAGCGFEERAEGSSISNRDEAAFVFKHLELLINELIEKDADHFPSAAVISPYREQVKLMNELLPQYSDAAGYDANITVNTIDSFQGQERDVVYISMTRSNPQGVIGFLSDIRRMNVAMTRARKKLVVVGDSSTLSRLPFYSEFISYAEKLNAWQSAWEYL